MPEVVTVLARCGGVAPIQAIVQAGLTTRAVQRATFAGAIVRVRRGWYALPSAHPEVIRAIRVGGSLACISGCNHHGLWRPPGNELHVSTRHGARHIKHPDTGTPVTRENPAPGLVTHWGGPANSSPRRGVLSLTDCLTQVIQCQTPDIAFAIVESALRRGMLTDEQRRAIAQKLSGKRRRLLERADRYADSGTESLFRYRMLCLGIEMRSQVEIPGVGRVDFVIGDRLVIEIDSNEHHGKPHQRARDLGRDAILAGLAFVCLRFDYDQVIWDWTTVESTVLAIVDRGEHLSSPLGSRR